MFSCSYLREHNDITTTYVSGCITLTLWQLYSIISNANKVLIPTLLMNNGHSFDVISKWRLVVSAITSKVLTDIYILNGLLYNSIQRIWLNTCKIYYYICLT